jgi:hypothetical protein
MAKVLTIADTRKMSKTKIETKLGEYAKELEKLGMDHVSSCELLSSIMNLGIAAHELAHNTN